MSMGPDALGSKTETSTVRCVPPVTRGSSPAVAEVTVDAAIPSERIAVTATVRATVCMVAPRVNGAFGFALPGGCGADGRGVLHRARSWYIANIGLLVGLAGVPCR